jgi:Flp pilus assembly pilin Flp
VQQQDARKNYIGIVNDAAEEESLAGSSARAQPSVVSYLVGRLAIVLKRPGKAAPKRPISSWGHDDDIAKCVRIGWRNLKSIDDTISNGRRGPSTCVLTRPRKISESIYHSENGTSLGWTDEQELTMTLLKSFLADENGATAIEYCLIATGIALAIITAVNNTGGALLSGKFNSISAAVK